jgi:hypothetical protein
MKKKYGALTAVEVIEKRGSNVRVRYRCDCGSEVIAYRHNVQAGRTRSCGCLHTCVWCGKRCVKFKDEDGDPCCRRCYDRRA